MRKPKPKPPRPSGRTPPDHYLGGATEAEGHRDEKWRGRHVMSEPRYETAYELGKRIGHTDSVVCADCGVFVMDVAAHTRFHSILSAHAWSLAVLKTSHIAAHAHDRYDVAERIDSRKFDSWSADALAEVTRDLDQNPPEGPPDVP